MNIHRYAQQGDIQGVQQELASGVPVDLRDDRDITPLGYAAAYPAATETMLRVLIDAGADVNAPLDKSERYPISMAACSGAINKVQVLLDAGANLKYETASGYTVLVHAVYALNGCPELIPMLEFLIKKGAMLHCKTKYGETPLIMASFFGRMDAVRCLLDQGADPSELQWTPLMKAVALGTASEVKQLLDGGCGVQADKKDRSGRTAWLLNAVVGDQVKGQLLLGAGADLEERGKVETTALMSCAARNNVDMLTWLLEAGADIEATDDSGETAIFTASGSGATECLKQLLKAGADANHTDHHDRRAIGGAANLECARLLVAAGQDLNDIGDDLKRELTAMKGPKELQVTGPHYHAGKHRRFGAANPQVMDIPLWRELVRTGLSAYHARKQFDDLGSLESPVWCFNRYGMSFTELPDGRFVQIAGEHEDSYDPDFCIYNEVVVHDGSGEFQIFGYPEDVFPPTDFHSATYFEGYIYIVGNLGYHGTRRFGFTPIYRLDCASWRIETVESRGEMPGWIFEHRARLENQSLLITSGQVAISVNGEEDHRANAESFRLDLTDMTWRRQGQM